MITISNSLERFSDIIDRIQKSNGRLEKESILREYSNDEPIKNIFKFIYNPYIVTGISKKKFNKNVLLDPYKDFYSIEDVMEYLKSHNSGKDRDIANIQHFVAHNYRYKDIIESIVTKDLKIGIQPITFNKVWGKGTIPSFDVMLAEKYFDNPEKYLPEGTEFTLTTKLDGVRCICLYNDEEDRDIEFFSRQGQPIYGLEEIKDDVCRFLTPGYVYDGELLLKNRDNLKSDDLYRATVKEVNKDDVKKDIIFNIFDIIKLENFENNAPSVSYSIRRACLDKIDKQMRMQGKDFYINIVNSLYFGTDQKEINKWLDKITSAGGEGVMININSAPYECKRTRNLLKVKKMQTMDLKVVDMEEGDGVNKGRLGALKVEFPAPDGNTYIVDVGGGFTFEDRSYFWNNPNSIIGKIIEVQYFEVSKNEKGGYSLRFPVFKWIREDKTESSTY